jgi:rRNA biogenesis protein RRP5
LIDGLALATMKPSALNEEIVHFGDLKLGSIVKGRVASVEKTGIRIALSSTSAITGFIPVVHCSDAGTQSFLKKAKVGKKMKCRVLKLESSHRRVLLTAKPSLLDSDVNMFSSYDQCTFHRTRHCIFRPLAVPYILCDSRLEQVLPVRLLLAVSFRKLKINS